MRNPFKSLALVLPLALGLFAAAIAPAAAEDIDIFLGSSSGSLGNPNVLIVLDNTSNWSRQSQKWPGGLTQGQSEVRAIKQVVNSLGADINVGLMEFVTGGDANMDGGYVRSAIVPMTPDNKAAFGTRLDTIFNNINSPIEKRNSNTSYGNLMYDVYNYFKGSNSYSPTAVPSTLADPNGYTSQYGTFKSPLSAANSCGRTYVVFIGNADSNGPESDIAANTGLLAALGGNTAQMRLPNFTTATNTSTSVVGTTSQCYASADSCSPAEFAAQCGNFSEGCSCTTPVASSAPAICAPGTQAYSVIKSQATSTTTQSSGTPITRTATSTVCYNNDNQARSGIEGSGTDHGGLVCPATEISGNTTTTYSCSYKMNAPATAPSCSKGKRYTLTETAIPNITTTSPGTPITSILGYTSQCYADAASCSIADYATQCGGSGASCSCGSPTASSPPSCPDGTSRYNVVGTDTTTAVIESPTSSTDTGPRNADEWARFLFQRGIPVDGVDNESVTTYTIDVFNAHQSATQTALLWNMAKAGGGKYFQARNENAILEALKKILNEIQAVNTTFASASLPVNATNRSQNENQVFIGMFRPDADARPRWFGNMKQYKLVKSGNSIELGDVNGELAVNTATGFLTECAASFWTKDSGTYWEGLGFNPDPAGRCNPNPYSPYSDLPDGPLVEKGAVAQVIRSGNGRLGADSTWAKDNRKVLTMSGSALAAFDTSSSGLDSKVVDFMLGKDIDVNGTLVSLNTRPTVHGDVIHSRPLPVNYGGSTGVTVFYGANDGTLRAVDSISGHERWAFIAPEFFPALPRLVSNSPLVSYPGVNDTPPPAPKDYYFDGSIGLYQNADNSKVWIYPTMRRGGRMIYALDVSDPANPSFKWKAGCPNLANDTGCSSGMAGIGQTWSAPNVAFIKGHSTANPVLIVGGGYDKCEDTNDVAPACANTKGNAVYVLDAADGRVLYTYQTSRAVAGDVSLVDIDSDGYPDYAYAADTGGNLYRIAFIDSATGKALGADKWTARKIAYTNGGGRKFLFGPSLLASKEKKVYVAIGSGDRERPLQTDYPFDSVTNRFYVYRDELSGAADAAAVDMDSLADYTTDTGATGLASSSLKGWFMDLNQYGQGEQTVTSALIAGGMVAFSTNRPIAPAAGTCATTLGEARGYWVNLLNGSGAIGVPGNSGGSRSSVFVGGGLPPSPVLASGVPIDGKPTTIVIGGAQRQSGESVSISPQQLRPPISMKRKRVYYYHSGN